MKRELTEKEEGALVILKSTGIDVSEAAMLAKEALILANGKLQQAHKYLITGYSVLKEQKKTVSFARAVDEAIDTRKDSRKRTLQDFRYICKRLMKNCIGLSNKKVHSITAMQCKEYIETSFNTPRQRKKARLVLSAVFSTAKKRGWCSKNPITDVETPIVREKRIKILTFEEITRLVQTAKLYNNGSCLAAVGLMLYAGVRPNEVARLSWEQIDLKRGLIYILPQHSKTGGARRITIQKPLLQLLLSCQKDISNNICPKNWLKNWQKLRQVAGWGKRHPWTPDVLRHTFASYHLEQFQSYEQLQYAMGHSSSALLRTRYVDATGVENAAIFWGEQINTPEAQRASGVE